MLRIVAFVAALSMFAIPCRAEPEPPPAEKQPAVAVALSLGSFLAGAALTLAGGSLAEGEPGLGRAVGAVGLAAILVGPSAGHMYSGEWGHAALMSGVRLAAFATAFWGFKEVIEGGISNALDGDEEPSPAAAPAFLLGTLIGTAATCYDIYDSARAARRANRWQVTPALLPGYGGPAPGLSLSVAF